MQTTTRDPHDTQHDTQRDAHRDTQPAQASAPPRAARRKRWGLIALGTAIGLALLYGFWPRATSVEVAEVVRGRLQVELEEEGVTRLQDRYAVTAPVAAYAPRIDLEVGDPVEAGQVLVELEPLRSDVLDPRRRAAAAAQVQAAEAALRAAEEQARAAATEAASAEADLARVRGLHEAGSATTQLLDQTEAAADGARARQRSAEAHVEVARYELAAARTALTFSAATARTGEGVPLRAPVAGRVLQVHHRSEGVVAPGAPLVDVGDPSALEVVVDVLSSDAVALAPDMRVRFERWGGDEALDGRVRRVEPTAFTRVSALGVEEQRVLVVADLASPAAAWHRLGDGYRVIAHFILWDGEDVLLVPTSALFRTETGWAAFAVEGGRARRRDVEVGHRSGLQAQVVAGLAEGDRVVVHPDAALEDEARVRVR